MTIAVTETTPTGSLPERIEFARALAQASLIPRTYQQQPANILVAMELGAALGIAPIVAINEVNVINGSPSLSASLMAALARQAGHKVRVTGDGTTATCTIVRADDPDFEHTATWDEKKARDGGLWGKGHWAKDPATMLKWRAISECVRFACSEVLGGIRYTPDEVEAMHPAPATAKVQQVTPEVRPPSLTDAVQSHRSLNGDPPAFTEPEGEPLRTEAQSRKLFATARDAGISNDELKPFMANLLGRVVESSKTLTRSEAGKVIEALENAKDQPDTVDPDTGEVLFDAELVHADDEWPAVAGVK